MKKQSLYPCDNLPEEEKSKQIDDKKPLFVGNAPNYDAFEGWAPEEVLCFLNID